MKFEVAHINTHGGGISFVQRNAIQKAMLRYDSQNRCYIEFYGEQGLLAITDDKFDKKEDAKFWLAIRFAHLLKDLL